VSLYEWTESFLFFGILILLTPLVGMHLLAVFQSPRNIFTPFFGWLEQATYRIINVDPSSEMDWKTYAKALVGFNVIGFIFLFGLLMFQSYLPFNPQHFPGLAWPLAFNTAVSFVTNTNWQAYAGETTLSYGSQMLGLTVQNFLSAATGNAVLLAFIRGITRQSKETIGNFWSDLTKTIVYVLLPFSIIIGILLASQGVIQTVNSYVTVTTLQGDLQTIPLGPVASQVAIKQLGTNGGGFFQANSAHPFENPNPLTYFLEALSILLIPAASAYMYGLMLKKPKNGRMFYAVMFAFLIISTCSAVFFETQGNPHLDNGPYMEGKEVRSGVYDSIQWGVATTATSNGSVNAMHDSFTPISGGITLLLMMLGEVVYGGVGVGMCGMLMYGILTIFLVGLMVGRTPEFEGKKIQRSEIQWVIVAILTPSALILLGSGFTSVYAGAQASLGNKGPHGLTEILYAFSSAAGNNGSAFAGLNANTNYFNIVLGLIMIIGRVAVLIPSLAIAGTLAKKISSPPSAGTIPTSNFFFGLLLFSVICIVGALTFFPALALGPIIEELLMVKGKFF